MSVCCKSSAIDSRSPGGSICTASRGNFARSSASPMTARMAAFDRAASDPPRRMTAFPAFKQSALASAVTFGRAS